MRSLVCKASVLAPILLFLTTAASGADKFKRIAVMPFENTTQEKTLNWIGGGISECLTTGLANISGFTMVERTRLSDALKEIKLGQSASVDPATAQKMGKILGADSIIIGSFLKFQDNIRIMARVVEVETAEVRSTARVDGAYNKLPNLQDDLSAKLALEMKGSLPASDKRKLEALPSKNLDAVQALSDGAYFLRSDMIQDAVKQFDRAIALDANYIEAHYYKGVALARLKQWDEAIASLKRTLPRATNERRVKWSWDVPSEAQASQRGIVFGTDQSSLSTQGPSTIEEQFNARKAIAYAERSGKNTILYFVDLAARKSTRVEIPDANIPLTNISVYATDQVAIVSATTPAMNRAGSLSFYGVSPKGGVLWHADLIGAPSAQAFSIAWGNTLFEYFSNEKRIVALDAVTHQKKWERDNFVWYVFSYHVKGDLAIFRNYDDNKFHGIRLSDGQDVWTLDYAPASHYQLVTDQALIVFEPDRRVFAVDLASGKIFIDQPIAPLAIQPDNNPYAFSVPSFVQDNLLYFVSASNELCAVDLNRSTPASRQLKWKTPLQTRVLSIRKNAARIYAGSVMGEFLIVDAETGKLQISKKIVADQTLSIVSANDSVVVVNTPGLKLALNPKSGDKEWEYPNVSTNPTPPFKGVVLTRPSALQLTLRDEVTGNILWQNAGASFGVWIKDDSIFVLEPNGIKEYVLDRNASQGITNKEAITELAGVFLSKGDLDEAERLAGQVAREADPDYPALRLVQARLSQARGNALLARRELADYTDLVGRQSRAGQEAIADLKRNAGLNWQSEVGAPFVWMNPDIAEGKILGAALRQIVALDAATGKLSWRQSPGPPIGSIVYDDMSKRFFWAQWNDPKIIYLNSIGIDGANLKEVTHFTSSGEVTNLYLAYAKNRVFAASLSIDRNSGARILDIAAYDADSGTRVWQKTHPYTTGEIAQIRVQFGLFLLRGEFLVYSSGKKFWVVRAENGDVYYEGHENEPIEGEKSGNVSSIADPDLLFLKDGANEIVVYRLSSKREVLRTKLSGKDPRFSPCACSVRGTTLFEIDGSDIVAFDLTPGSANAGQAIWRLLSGPGQQFYMVQPRGDYLMAVRRIAGSANMVGATILQIDPASGTILKEFNSLWAPLSATIAADHMYAFTVDGMAYAMDSK
jgi:TolB-like protein/outer membrane protein assembly factor BamB